ncbi:hypothetical protein SPI_07206 [Niveomyces insectorum RCEF 264]|uniref:Uncharacterized protein n=1 Tax=Niveomyces insectorum RCEF 264 TaxID=1081102 RepID=A0A167QDR1_9HYPO|nr:hypothetical protein SPI_07206 [Niveomyces insectorum RCEF 264]
MATDYLTTDNKKRKDDEHAVPNGPRQDDGLDDQGQARRRSEDEDHDNHNNEQHDDNDDHDDENNDEHATIGGHRLDHTSTDEATSSKHTLDHTASGERIEEQIEINDKGALEMHERPRSAAVAPAANDAVGPCPRALVDAAPIALTSLDYNPWDHRRKLVLMTALLMAEFCFLPVTLYYALRYDTNLSEGVLFAIVTSFFGVVTGVEFAIRCWRLLGPASTYRPLGGGRWGFDATHVLLTIVFTAMTGLLIGASVPAHPRARVLALPSTVFFLVLATVLLATGYMAARGRPAPCRISSVPKGAPIRPLVYTLVEDVVGVDGAGGKAYRQRLAVRWAQSWRFRRLLAQMNWLWGVGVLVGGIATLVVLIVAPEDIAYGFGFFF